MTILEYYDEMMDLYFHLILAYSVITNQGMTDFYFDKFNTISDNKNKLTEEDSGKTVDQSQIENLKLTQNLVKEIENIIYKDSAKLQLKSIYKTRE